MRRFVLALFVAVMFLAGCSTVREIDAENHVEPLALIDEKLSVYVSIPVASNSELVEEFLCSQIPGLSKKDASVVAGKLDTVYAGLGTVKDRSCLELSVSASIPKIYETVAFSKKNGWQKSGFNAVNGASYNRYVRSGIQVALPDSGVLCCSKSVDSMLERHSLPAVLEDNERNNWLVHEDGDIRFYVTRPGQFLRNLIGQAINVGTDAVWGTMRRDADRYWMDFFIRFNDKRTVSVVKALLSLSFGMTGSGVTQIDELTLRVSDIEISQKQISDMLMRDPITGKHYRVVNDNIIEENRKK